MNVKHSKAKTILFYLTAGILGTVFIFSGIVKAIDPLGTVYKIEDYLVAMNLEALTPLATVAAFLLFTCEFTAGIMLLLNLNFRIGLWTTTLFMAVMTPLTVWIAIADPVSDCGCFGDAIVLSNIATLTKNIIIDILIVILWLLRGFITPPKSKFSANTITLTFTLAIIGFGIHAINHLPLLDFRPYKIGTNILNAMELPEGAKSDVYETTFIYSKNGIEQEFSLQNVPYNDSTWTFVDQHTVLVSKGDEPLIHDFAITSIDGDDLTYEILDSDKKIYLAIMYDLNKTNKRNICNVDKIYRKAQAENALFLALTASVSMIDDFKNRYNIEYDFAVADPIMLKTMIRANPGILILQDAEIIDKFNPNCHYKKLRKTHFDN